MPRSVTSAEPSMFDASRPTLCVAGTHYPTEKRGGVESQVLNIGRILTAAGWQVAFLCPSLSGRSGPERMDNGDLVYWFPQPSYGFQISARLINEMLDAIHPSAIYQRGKSMLQESGHVARYARAHRIPVVFGLSLDTELIPFESARGVFTRSGFRWRSLALLPYFFWSDLRMRRTLTGTPHLVAQHRDQMEIVRRTLGRGAHLLRTLHPELAGPARKSERPRVVWITNYRPLKQGEMFVRLARDCSDLDCEFVMVYGRTKPIYLERIMELARTTPNISLHGELPAVEAERLLEEATIFVNTSLYEGFPNTFVQAWLRETPTVSLHVNPENVLVAQDIGRCSGTYDRLVGDVRELITDRSLGSAMGKRAREYAEREHGLNHNAPKIVAFFSRIVEMNAGTRRTHELFDWSVVE